MTTNRTDLLFNSTSKRPFFIFFCLLFTPPPFSLLPPSYPPTQVGMFPIMRTTKRRSGIVHHASCALHAILVATLTLLPFTPPHFATAALLVAEPTIFPAYSFSPTPGSPGFAAKRVLVHQDLIVTLDATRGVVVFEDRVNDTEYETFVTTMRGNGLFRQLATTDETSGVSDEVGRFSAQQHLFSLGDVGSGRQYDDVALGVSSGEVYAVLLHSLNGAATLSVLDLSAARSRYSTPDTAWGAYLAASTSLSGLSCTSLSGIPAKGVFHLCCAHGVVSYRVKRTAAAGVFALVALHGVDAVDGVAQCKSVTVYESAGRFGFLVHMEESIAVVDATAAGDPDERRPAMVVRSVVDVAAEVHGYASYGGTLLVSEKVRRLVDHAYRETDVVAVHSTADAHFVDYCCTNTTELFAQVSGNKAPSVSVEAFSPESAGCFFAHSAFTFTFLRFCFDANGRPQFSNIFDFGRRFVSLFSVRDIVMAPHGRTAYATLEEGRVLRMELFDVDAMLRTPAPPTGAPPSVAPLPPSAAPLTPLPPTTAPLTPTAVPHHDTTVPVVTSSPSPPVSVRTSVPDEKTALPTTDAPGASDEGSELNATWHTEAEQDIALKEKEVQEVSGAVAALGVMGMSSGGVGAAMRLVVITHMCNLASEEKKAAHLNKDAGDTKAFPLTFHPTQITVNGSPDAGLLVGNLLAVITVFVLSIASVLLVERVYIAPKMQGGREEGAPDLTQPQGMCLCSAVHWLFFELGACTDAAGLLRFPSLPFFVFRYFFQGSTLAAFTILFNSSTPTPAEEGASENATEALLDAGEGSATLFHSVAALSLLLAVFLPFLMGFTVAGHLKRGALVFKVIPFCRVERRLSGSSSSKMDDALQVRETGGSIAVTKCQKLQYFFCGEGEWLSRERDNHVANRFTIVVRNIREGFVVKYFVVDFVASVVLSLLVAVDSGSHTACGHKNMVAALVFLALLVLEGSWLPHVRPAETIFMILMLICKCMALFMSSFAYYTHQPEDSGVFDTSASILLVATAALVLMTVTQLLTDLYIFVNGRRRNAQEAHFAQAAEDETASVHFPTLDNEIEQEMKTRQVDTQPASPLAHLRNRLLGSPSPVDPPPALNAVASPSILQASRNFLSTSLFRQKALKADRAPSDDDSEEEDCFITVRQTSNGTLRGDRKPAAGEAGLGKSMKCMFTSLLNASSPRRAVPATMPTSALKPPHIPRLGMLALPADQTPLCSARTFCTTTLTESPTPRHPLLSPHQVHSDSENERSDGSDEDDSLAGTLNKSTASLTRKRTGPIVSLRTESFEAARSRTNSLCAERRQSAVALQLLGADHGRHVACGNLPTQLQNFTGIPKVSSLVISRQSSTESCQARQATDDTVLL